MVKIKLLKLIGWSHSKISKTMGSVWKRLQRVNKRAAKFQFTVSYHQVTVETTPKW